MRCFLAGALVLSLACADDRPPAEPVAPVATADDASSDSVLATPADLWWSSWSSLCGKAFAGRLVSSDPVDADFAEESMVMHVRRCAEDRIEVPFHVGGNRSRTWVLTRTETGIRLQHDHRHEDGHEDEVTLYGGHTTEAGTVIGDVLAQDFPADDYSKRLFESNELTASVDNVWTFEIVPDERVSYILRRPERHFQVDFDLTAAVEPPPSPWGHEAVDPQTATEDEPP